MTALDRRDLHVHTRYCQHAVGTMTEYVRSALNAGLDEIGFLAHAEVGIRYYQRNWLDDELLDRYWQEGQTVRQEHEGNIRVSLGLELGLNPARIAQLRAIARRYPWDRIGLSYHYLADDGEHLNICSSRADNVRRLCRRDLRTLCRHYFSVLRDHLDEIRPDMLCHLDVIRRNLPVPDLEQHCGDIVSDILDWMARTRAVLEVNTSGYHHQGRKPYPAEWIVARALERRVPLVLSSDSHHPSQVGRHFNRAMDYLRALMMAPSGG